MFLANELKPIITTWGYVNTVYKNLLDAYSCYLLVNSDKLVTNLQF